MNKLLTTITLLFFSVAANADIYFCQPRHYAEANQNFTMTVNKEEFDNESRDPNTFGWKVDTERGISIAAFNDYGGSCEEDSELIRCEREIRGEYIDTRFTSVVIVKSKLLFVDATINVEIGTGTTTSGTCTKI
jgi:hypothetical protein